MPDPRPRSSSGAARADSDVDAYVVAVLTASRVLVGISARSLARAEDTVTLPQFRALVVLHSRGASSLNRVADDLQVTASTAMRMVDRLIANGLVTREENPADRREVLIELTRKGKRLVQTVTARRRTEIERVVDRMSPSRREGLIAALHAFNAAAGEPEVGGAVAEW